MPPEAHMIERVLSLAIVAFATRTFAAPPIAAVDAQPAAADRRVAIANAPDAPAEIVLARIVANGADQRLFSAEIKNRGDAALTSIVLRLARVGADGSLKQSQGRHVPLIIAPGASDLITIQLSDPPFPLDEGDRVVTLVAEASSFGGRVWRIDPER